MNRQQVQTIVVILKLLDDAESKAIANGQKIAEETGDSLDELKHDVNRWELVFIRSFLMSLLREECGASVVRDLYGVGSVRISGWHISWKPTDVEEQWEEIKDDPFIQHFMENFPFDDTSS